MKRIPRSLAVTALAGALVVAACGSGTSTGAPATQGSAATPAVPAGTAGSGGALSPETIPAALLAPIFGATIPEPTCGDMAPSGDYCRWATADQSIVVDVQRDGQFGSEDAWRAAFATAGFDEDLPELGIPALGGTTPLSAGYRAAAYGPDRTSYSVSLTHSGDPATVKGLALTLLRAFAGA